MKQKQLNELATLEKFIPTNWDWINMWWSWKFNWWAIYTEWSDKRFNPERTYFLINGWGKKWFETGDISQLQRLNRLLMAKRRYDLQMTSWIADVKDWIIFISELEEEYPREAQIIKDKLTVWDAFNVYSKYLRNGIEFDMWEKMKVFHTVKLYQ